VQELETTLNDPEFHATRSRLIGTILPRPGMVKEFVAFFYARAFGSVVGNGQSQGPQAGENARIAAFNPIQ
jgi:hypothetical protein